jgi:hypothetical protein
VLAAFSGGVFDIHNLELYYFVNKLSNISGLISFLPVHPILFILSLISSIKYTQKGFAAFHIASIIFTFFWGIAVSVCHTWLIGGA